MNTWIKILALSSVAGLLLLASARAEDPSKWTKTEQLLIQAQKICPVSGQPLDSMGGPIKAESGEQAIFLCCKGCMGKPISAENWAKVTANLRLAQGKCPVMGKPLPADAASVVVDHRLVFVCCKPCTGKVQKDSAKYLAVVDQYLSENVGKTK